MLNATDSPLKFRDREWLMMNVCDNYLSNRCDNLACPNAHCHPSMVAMDMRKKKVIVCFESLKGVCSRINCCYYHAMDEQKPQIIQYGRERQRLRQEAQMAPQLSQFTGGNEMCHISQQEQSTMLTSKARNEKCNISFLEPSILGGLNTIPSIQQQLLNHQMNLQASRFPVFSQPTLVPVSGNMFQQGYPFNVSLQTTPLVPNPSAPKTCYPTPQLTPIINVQHPIIANSLHPQIFSNLPSNNNDNNSEALQLAANLLLSQGYIPVQCNPNLLQTNYCLPQSATATTNLPYQLPFTIPTSVASYPSLLNQLNLLQQSTAIHSSPPPSTSYELLMKHHTIDGLEPSNYYDIPTALRQHSPSAYKICALHSSKNPFLPYTSEEMMAQTTLHRVPSASTSNVTL